MRSFKYIAAAVLSIATLGTAAAQSPSVPAYDHIFLIIEENHGYTQIIGNSQAPNLNALAKTYGLATRYFSVADPSAPNYVVLLGGNWFGIADDNAYYLHFVDKPNLLSQLDKAGISWKGYFQSMPYAGYLGLCAPGRCNGVPDVSALYGAKHNGIVYFRDNITREEDRRNMVPITDLAQDLAGTPPRFGYIVPDHCTDMHGSPPWCADSGNFGDVLDNDLVKRGDAYVGKLVSMITSAPFWSRGNNAIVVTFDEGNGTKGCCDADPGTGRIYTTVITSNGPRALTDNTPYNHYSLLQTIQIAFGVGCLEFTCDTKNVVPMAPLFAVTK